MIEVKNLSKSYGSKKAVDNICKHYTLFESDLAIVVDESCVDKIDMPALVEKFTVYKV